MRAFIKCDVWLDVMMSYRVVFPFRWLIAIVCSKAFLKLATKIGGSPRLISADRHRVLTRVKLPS